MPMRTVGPLQWTLDTAADVALQTVQPALDAIQEQVRQIGQQVPQPSFSSMVPSLEALLGSSGQPAAATATTAPAGGWLSSVPSLDDLMAAAGLGRAQQQPGAAPPAFSGSPVGMPTLGAAPAGPMAPVEIDRSSVPAFMGSFLPAAEQALAARGLPTTLAPILAAIPVNEQGISAPAPGNNYYGIKGSNPRTGANTGPVATWEDYGGGRTNIQDTFRAYDSPAESVQDFLQFLEDNPRYAGALDVARRTGDPGAFIKAVHAAGYATDPAWSDKVLSIAAQAPARPVGPQPTTPPQAEQVPAAQRQALEGITPNQFALGDADAEAICGPVLAMAFARSNGRNPTIAEAKEMARQFGGWTSAQGMGGPEAMARTLREMGVPATYRPGAIDVEEIRRETQGGNPVGINTQGHYFVVEGVDEQGRLNLGNSARILRASGGRQWFRPEEIAGLGMGAPTGVILKDAPSSPTPSVAVRETGMPPVNQQQPAAPWQDAQPGGPAMMKATGEDQNLPEPPDGNPGWPRYYPGPPNPDAEGVDDRGRGRFMSPPRPVVPEPALRVSPDEMYRQPLGTPDAFLPGDGGTPPQAENQPTAAPTAPFLPGDGAVPPEPPYDPRDADSGPREATPGSVGSQPLPQTANPMTYGPIEQAPEPLGPEQPPHGGSVGRNWGDPPMAPVRGGGFVEDVVMPVVRAVSPRRSLPETVSGAVERGGSMAPPEPGSADAGFQESVRTVTRPVNEAFGSAAAGIEDTLGMPAGSVRQAAEDVSNVLGPTGPMLGVVRRSGGMADDAARMTASAIPRQERAAQLANPIKLSDAEQVARIRLDKFPEEVHDELLAAARGSGFGEGLRRGVLSDDAVQTLAAEYAPTVDAAIAAGRRGRAYSAEEVVGLRNLMVGQAERVATLGRELADARAAGQIDTVLLAQHAIEGDKLRALGNLVFGGAPAEAGRALRQFRMLAQSLKDDPAGAGLRYLKQRFGTLEKAEEVAAQYQTMVDEGADPVALASFLRTAQGDWLNRLGIIRYASMLSSTTTHLINATGNALMQGVDLATKPLAVGVDVARSRATGGPRAVFLAEWAAQRHGMAAGAMQGLQDAAFIMRNGFRPEDVTKLDYLRQGFGTNIPGVAPAGSRAANAADLVIEGPLRALAASDAVFRSMARGGHLAAEATAEAMRRNGGGRATADQVGQLMADPKVIERAEALSTRAVLQERRGITDWIVGRSQLSTPERVVVEAVLPFVRTPYNIVAQGVGMSPAGAIKALYDAGRGQAPPRELADRLARSAVGTAVMGVAAWQFLNGNLTGAYPEDEKERSTLPPGWRPWSFRVDLPGAEARYISMASLGPLAVPAAVAVILADGAKKGAAWDPGTVAMGLGQFAADQTFLRGIADVAKALSEGGTKLENVTENVASSYTPHFLGGGALGRQVQQVLGMPQRDPKGAWEAIQAQFPYLAGNVPVRRDVLGRASQTGATGLEAAISPWRAGVENDEPVIAAFRSAGEGLPTRAPVKVRDPGSGRVVELTREQQDTWRVAFGGALERQWRAAGRPRRTNELRAVEQDARDEALQRVLRR